VWRSRLEDILAIQGVHDLVANKLPRPIESDSKDGKSSTRTSEQGYNPEDSTADWDALLDIARSTVKLTLSVDLSIRYKDVKPANTLLKTICDAYEKNTRARRLLKSVKLTPADQQIYDRLLRGLDDSWKPIRDHLVYSPNDAIGALEAHEVSTTASLDHSPSEPLLSESAAKAKQRLG
jgi:hypothetical protein